MSLVTLIQKLNSADRDAVVQIEEFALPKEAVFTGKVDEAGRAIYTLFTESKVKAFVEKVETEVENAIKDVEKELESLMSEAKDEANTVVQEVKTALHKKKK